MDQMSFNHQAALVLIEFQQEWEQKLSKLMLDRDQFAQAVTGGQRAIVAARAAGMLVAHVGLFFDETYQVLGQTAAFGLRHAIPQAGTFSGAGSQWIAGFEPQPGEFVAAGRSGASAFTGSNLDVFLRNQGIQRIYLAGFALQVCVLASLVEGHDKGYETVVLEDASAAFTPEIRQFMLHDVIHHFGGHMTVAAFEQQLTHQPISTTVS